MKQEVKLPKSFGKIATDKEKAKNLAKRMITHRASQKRLKEALRVIKKDLTPCPDQALTCGNCQAILALKFLEEYLIF